MSGTVAYEFVQYLNQLNRVYSDASYMLDSGVELLVDLENLKLEQDHVLASLDVVNLITNFPIQETINLSKAYKHATLHSSQLPERILPEVL